LQRDLIEGVMKNPPIDMRSQFERQFPYADSSWASAAALHDATPVCDQATALAAEAEAIANRNSKNDTALLISLPACILAESSYKSSGAGFERSLDERLPCLV
jgi:hypothetical protein